jgi:hypothetical protein
MTVRDYTNVYDEVSGNEAIKSTENPVHFAGCTPASIPAHGEVTYTFNLNMDMNLRKLIIPDAFAPNVAVAGATIGPIQISAGEGPTPGDAFRASSEVVLAPAVPITNGQPLKVRVINLTDAAIPNFFMGITGIVKRSA